MGLLALACQKTRVPTLLWNVSPSIPTGLYMLKSQAPAKGQLAVIQLPDPARTLADARGYLPANARLIKPVVAGPGDAVCRHGPIIRINGPLRALAHMRDARQHLLPRWHGCRRLAPSELFVLSTVSGSFDSRYFGPVNSGNVMGTAMPIWTR